VLSPVASDNAIFREVRRGHAIANCIINPSTTSKHVARLLTRLKEKAQGPKWRRVWTPLFCIFVAVVEVIIAFISNNIDKPTMVAAATSLITMASFLAAASGVLISIYMGQVLKALPTLVDRIRPAYIQGAKDSLKRVAQELQARRQAETQKQTGFFELISSYFSA
jgi:hypothetical protein